MTTVLPRDLKPGDRIDRLGPDLSVETATITEVRKVQQIGHTYYRIYLDGVEGSITLQPNSKVTLR